MDLRFQSLTSKDASFWRLKLVPVMKELIWAKHDYGRSNNFNSVLLETQVHVDTIFKLCNSTA